MRLFLAGQKSNLLRLKNAEPKNDEIKDLRSPEGVFYGSTASINESDRKSSLSHDMRSSTATQTFSIENIIIGQFDYKQIDAEVKAMKITAQKALSLEALKAVAELLDSAAEILSSKVHLQNSNRIQRMTSVNNRLARLICVIFSVGRVTRNANLRKFAQAFKVKRQHLPNLFADTVALLKAEPGEKLKNTKGLRAYRDQFKTLIRAIYQSDAYQQNLFGTKEQRKLMPKIAFKKRRFSVKIF